jgi:hypothetical protein
MRDKNSGKLDSLYDRPAPVAMSADHYYSMRQCSGLDSNFRPERRRFTAKSGWPGSRFMLSCDLSRLPCVCVSRSAML